MARYKPTAPFTVALMLLVPTLVTAKGSPKKVYPATGDIINCSFRSFGGTEVQNNGVLTIENTAKVQTWYRPDITADCRLQTSDNRQWEIIGGPENVEMRNQYLNITIRLIEGGA